MNKFVLILPNSTLQQQVAVKNLFPPARAAWWHWASEVFLISTQENPTVNELRDELQRTFPGLQTLVFKIEGGSHWAGWGPLDWQKWFDQFWP
jgi:hypothetical protein